MPHRPKVRMGRSGGGAAFLRKAISRIGERNVVGQKKNGTGIPTIYADDVVYSQIAATDQIWAEGRVGIGNGESTRAGLGSAVVA